MTTTVRFQSRTFDVARKDGGPLSVLYIRAPHAREAEIIYARPERSTQDAVLSHLSAKQAALCDRLGL